MLQHREGYTYARVLHDGDCPAVNRRGIALIWPDKKGHNSTAN